MDMFYCRAVVSVFDPETKHAYNERVVKRVVESVNLEGAREAFLAQQIQARFPVLPAEVLVKFKSIVQMGGDYSDVGVIPFKAKRRR